MPLRAAALLLLLLGCEAAPAQTFRARVVKVADGDSLTVRDAAGRAREVRISGIDAPEGRQAFGREAKTSLVRLLEGNELLVEVEDVDRYGRLVARLTSANRDVGLTQIEAGMAWSYPWAEGVPKAVKERYRAAERTAKRDRTGLWRDPAPTPPWVFRRGDASGAATDRAWAPERTSPEATSPVIGNRNSKLYHLPHCPGYQATSAKNRVAFASAAEAEKAGYRRAGNCP